MKVVHSRIQLTECSEHILASIRHKLSRKLSEDDILEINYYAQDAVIIPRR